MNHTSQPTQKNHRERMNYVAPAVLDVEKIAGHLGSKFSSGIRAVESGEA